MEKGERENVYKVYDKIANWFSANRNSALLEKKHLDKIIALLPADATILDIGCGTGKPIFEYLWSKDLNVTGVDASTAMLSIAKSNFPSAAFILQDMRSLNLNKTFDAIIAWYSFFHLPAADQPAMFAIFEKHLNPNGLLLFTSGPAHGEAWGMNGGENLFHASLGPKEYEELLHKHHFKVMQYTEKDPECFYDTVWMAQYSSESV